MKNVFLKGTVGRLDGAYAAHYDGLDLQDSRGARRVRPESLGLFAHRRRDEERRGGHDRQVGGFGAESRRLRLRLVFGFDTMSN